MKSTMVTKKSFRVRTIAVFLGDKGPDLKWGFVDGSPCSSTTGISRDKLFSLVQAIDQKNSGFSPRSLKYKHPGFIKSYRDI